MKDSKAFYVACNFDMVAVKAAYKAVYGYWSNTNVECIELQAHADKHAEQEAFNAGQDIVISRFDFNDGNTEKEVITSVNINGIVTHVQHGSYMPAGGEVTTETAREYFTAEHVAGKGASPFLLMALTSRKFGPYGGQYL